MINIKLRKKERRSSSKNGHDDGAFKIADNDSYLQ